MSQIYSSSSGSYSNYLAQRQNDEVAKAINLQTAMNISAAAHMETGIRREMRQMSTGIQTSINKNTYAVVASSNMLKSTFQNGFDSINNTLDLGFAGVSAQLGCMTASMNAGFDMLSSKFEKWGTKICDKLDAIHDVVNNPLLTASRELYRRAVTNTSKKFYEEALEDIKGAVEKNRTDYISWGLMGKIYLFGISEFGNAVDVHKAVEVFFNACKYITPDIDKSDDAKKLASEYCFYLGYANYVLANESRLEGDKEKYTACLKECVKANEKSFALSNTMLESLYTAARAYSLLGQKKEALSCLAKIISEDAYYAIKALGDDDFKQMEADVVNHITVLRNELYCDFKAVLENLLHNYHFYDNKEAQNVLKQLSAFNEIPLKIPYFDLRIENEKLTELNNAVLNKRIPGIITVSEYQKKQQQKKEKIQHEKIESVESEEDSIYYAEESIKRNTEWLLETKVARKISLFFSVFLEILLFGMLFANPMLPHWWLKSLVAIGAIFLFFTIALGKSGEAIFLGVIIGLPLSFLFYIPAHYLIWIWSAGNFLYLVIAFIIYSVKIKNYKKYIEYENNRLDFLKNSIAQRSYEKKELARRIQEKKEKEQSLKNKSRINDLEDSIKSTESIIAHNNRERFCGIICCLLIEVVLFSFLPLHNILPIWLFVLSVILSFCIISTVWNYAEYCQKDHPLMDKLKWAFEDGLFLGIIVGIAAVLLFMIPSKLLIRIWSIIDGLLFMYILVSTSNGSWKEDFVKDRMELNRLRIHEDQAEVKPVSTGELKEPSF